MDTRSFSRILADFLEENSPSPAATPEANPSSFAPPPLFFDWSPPPTKAQRRNAYGSSTKAQPVTKSAPPPPAPVVETLIALDKLTDQERQALLIVVNLGGSELKSGLSPKRLKKAYRQLVKGLHPDHVNLLSLSMNERRLRQEQFLSLQDAYECLSEAIRARADGSECASGPDCPRRAAA
jgi:hypothetical protein